MDEPIGQSVCGECGEVFDCHGSCGDEYFVLTQRIAELEAERVPDELLASLINMCELGSPCEQTLNDSDAILKLRRENSKGETDAV